MPSNLCIHQNQPSGHFFGAECFDTVTEKFINFSLVLNDKKTKEKKIKQNMHVLE